LPKDLIHLCAERGRRLRDHSGSCCGLRQRAHRAGKGGFAPHAYGILAEPLEQRLCLAAVVWDGGPSGLGTNFHDAANWEPDGVPTGADDAIISVAANPTITITSSVTINSITSDEAITQSAGTFTINGASVFGALYSLSGGTLTGSGDLTFDAGLTWSGGTLGGTGLAVIPVGQTLAYTGGGLSRSINNFGTFNFGGSGSLIFDAGAILTNKVGGVLNHNSTGNLHAAGGGPVEAFINEGVYNKNGGGAQAFIFGLSVTNTATGVFNVNAGTLDWGGDGPHANLGTLNVPFGSSANIAVPLA